MVISHNLMAMNANRQFNINVKNKRKNTEKLSSGYKINRAADDAAGLSISEKMRNQIRGINQGVNNVEDGIALIKTAEGALQETHNILGRMRELAIQAANDVNEGEDRQAIQNEMDSLYKEIDDIANKTQFNGRYLLNGTESAGNASYVENGKRVYFSIYDESRNMTVVDQGYYGDKFYNVGDTITVHGIKISEDMEYLYLDNYAFRDDEFEISLSDVGCGVADLPMSAFTVGKNGYLQYHSYVYESWHDLEPDLYLVRDSNNNFFGSIGVSDYEKNKDEIESFGMYPVNPGWLGVYPDARSNLWIQSGANAGEGTYLTVVDGTAKGLGLSSVDVSTHQLAMSTVENIDVASKKVSAYRSHFGAQQNRLEHTVDANLNYSENLTSAESNLRDTDMAEEIMQNAKNDILIQASQSMLAQVNRSNQDVLSLLQ